MSQKQLQQEIIRRSVASNWRDARSEWILSEVYFADEPDTCLCGQYPIIELCVLTNQKNGREAIVGNRCVKRFLNLSSDQIFTGLKRVKAKPDAALNEAAIRYAHRRRWISDWELNFYLDTRAKRKLTDKQAAKRLEINQKVTANVAQDTRRSTSP
jgi:hypothetical protein